MLYTFRKMSPLTIILRPSLSMSNCWKIQINGLHDDQLNSLSKRIENLKFQRQSNSELMSIRWRIDTSRKHEVLPINHIAPLVNLFKTWGYELWSCETTTADFDSDIIFWTLVREEDKKLKSRKS